jgi:predicted dithiol-disulfide oxidoreductase (DUF899 family)
MPDHKVVSRTEWENARKALLAREKAFTQARDALTRERQALPWVRVEQTYTFEAPDGPTTLGDLCGTKSQLIVMHFMFGPDWQEGCPSCSFCADGFDPSRVHLAARDVAFAAVSRAPLAALEAYRNRMGWSFPWVSSLESTFNFDYAVSFTDAAMAEGEVYYNYARRPFPSQEAPGLSVFTRGEDGAIYHTYSCYARGLDMLIITYNLLDLCPKGRDEDSLPYTMSWVRRHDRYDANN